MEKMESYKIYYLYLKPENNRVVYVGMTSKHPAVRLYRLSHDNQQFVQLIEKYGPDCLGYKIIEFVETKEEAFIREAYWTGYYGGPDNLLNIGVGSNSRASTSKQEMRDFYDRTLRPWLKEHGGPRKGKGTKAVKCLETNKVYNSIVEAARDVNISPCNIVNACKGRILSAGGYTWRYVEKGDDT